MFIILIGILFASLHSISGGHIETVSASGCESCSIYLTCKHFTSIIAIIEASFVPGTNASLEVSTPFPIQYPRQCLNHRCSGNNHCSFILNEDCPGAKNYWGEGTLYVKYSCITEDRVVKYCNREIVLPDPNNVGISEGFIRNPGYPRFYGGQSPCRWKIRVPSEQRIQLTIFDISVIVDNPPTEGDCTKDRLEIIDSEILVYSTCHQKEPPKEYLSLSDSLEIVLYSSQRLTPLRGILLHYTAVGCPTPVPPADSYLVYINDTFAAFSCCVGYVFPDTGTKTRQLTCEGSTWSEIMPLPNCEQLEYPSASEPLPKLREIMASELIVPAVIIVTLFILNSMVLFFINRAKKRNEIEHKNEEIGALNSEELSAVVT
ncbi:uncharacterized protein LOC123310661 [Coccinella septempunctata]|uniref:uncharacterized protein LOC123310661 n=1 Tax=Coccinella septempunctata TaxID=41139 RepID=UPI001D0825FB|nr:uncharacterized protein LOC123310661 [Coccinella septempunctata]XP_044750150.1 uncharacterized protein LOC123310661 [Coccinella septempunctata]